MLQFSLVLITVIYCSLLTPDISSLKFKTSARMLPVLCAVLSGLATYLRSFPLYTTFLSNPVFSTKSLIINNVHHTEHTDNNGKINIYIYTDIQTYIHMPHSDY